MTSGKKPVTVSEKTSFSAVVDKACDRLLDQQARYSIRRIQEMESRLAGLERELDELLIHHNRK